MRRCPRCTFPLISHEGPVGALWHCSRCGGSFLTRIGVGKHLRGVGTPDSWAELGAARRAEQVGVSCPQGHGAMDGWETQDEDGILVVDACPTCSGIWLDAGEGQRLQSLIKRAAHQQREEYHTPTVRSYIFQLLTGFPIEDWNPVRRPARVIRALFLLIVAGFVTQSILVDPAAHNEWARGLFLVPTRLLSGHEPWTLITHLFMHAGFVHLAGNLWFHWVFGDNVEDTLGSGRTLLLWLLAGVVGSLCHVLANPDSTVPLVGASGAIAGLMGAYMVLFPRVRVWIVVFLVRVKIRATIYLLFWIGFQGLCLALSSAVGNFGNGDGGVAWFAHIGGFVTGVLFATVIRDSVQRRDLLRNLRDEREIDRHPSSPREPHVNQKRYTTKSHG